VGRVEQFEEQSLRDHRSPPGSRVPLPSIAEQQRVAKIVTVGYNALSYRKRCRMPKPCFRVRDEIAWRKMKDGTVTIVSPIVEKIISINKTAGMVWELLDGNRTVDAIVDVLHEQFRKEGVTRATIEDDVREILNSFVERQLVEQIVDSAHA